MKHLLKKKRLPNSVLSKNRRNTIAVETQKSKYIEFTNPRDLELKPILVGSSCQLTDSN